MMRFLPELPKPTFISKKNLFYWESQLSTAGREFQLYEVSSQVASLHLPDGRSHLGYFAFGKEVIEFRDNSSFFLPTLQLVSQSDRQCIGHIWKSPQRAEEGVVHLFGETHGWKLRTLHENSLLLMDPKHRRLITYHYGHNFVRLLLTKHAWDNLQLIPLLCIGLYLLPIWHGPDLTNS